MTSCAARAGGRHARHARRPGCQILRSGPTPGPGIHSSTAAVGAIPRSSTKRLGNQSPGSPQPLWPSLPARLRGNPPCPGGRSPAAPRSAQAGGTARARSWPPGSTQRRAGSRSSPSQPSWTRPVPPHRLRPKGAGSRPTPPCGARRRTRPGGSSPLLSPFSNPCAYFPWRGRSVPAGTKSFPSGVTLAESGRAIGTAGPGQATVLPSPQMPLVM